MAQVEQFSSFPHAASRAQSLLLENIEKEPTTVVSQVQRFHVALASGQRNTDVSSSLHKLIGIVEVRLLSAAAGRVRGRFNHDQVAQAVHGEHQALDQVAIVLMLLRVERDPCCTSLSLFNVLTIDRALPFRCLSSSTQRLRPGKAVELGLHRVLVIWQALRS